MQVKRVPYLGAGVARDVCGLECDGCDVAEGDAMVVDDVVVTTDDLGVDDEMDDVGMALDDTVQKKRKSLWLPILTPSKYR